MSLHPPHWYTRTTALSFVTRYRSRSPKMKDFPVIVRIPVQWGDMDAYGHVNNTVFFRYFEVARIAYLERCGLAQSRLTTGIGAILHSTSCRFRRPLQFPDEVVVGARVTDLSTDRFTHEYRVFSTTQEAVAAEGTGIIVAFNYQTGAKTELPTDVRLLISALEERTRSR